MLCTAKAEACLKTYSGPQPDAAGRNRQMFSIPEERTIISILLPNWFVVCLFIYLLYPGGWGG